MSVVALDAVVLILKTFYYILEGIVFFFVPRREKNVKGQIVLITGSGSGIGREMSLRFSKRGCRMVLLDVDSKGNDKTASMIREQGGHCDVYTCDLCDKASINRVVDKIQSDVGDIDILVNNAGIVQGSNLLDLTQQQVEKTFTVNVLCHFILVKAFLPSMLQKNQGHIVTIASAAGFVSVNRLTDYCSSKFAAVGFHEGIREEIRSAKKDGVMTTCVCPYYINTGMFDGIKTKFPNFLPILDPNYVADKIVHAALTDQHMISMPRIIYLFPFLKSLLPTKAFLATIDFFEVNKDMAWFSGRKKKATGDRLKD